MIVSPKHTSPMHASSSVSIIVPTFKEVESLEDLIPRLGSLRSQFRQFEVIIVDDNSQDGTEALIAKFNASEWLRLRIRKTERGLSSAVIVGCAIAQNDFIVVMDADLSHPPEAIPEMVQKLLEDRADFVIGSRYCEGGRIDETWGFFRKINSSFATLLARPFTRAKDPMSGFIALRRRDFLKAENLNPIGYKIGLEFIVKCRFNKILEIPIVFEDRKKGESKLSLKEQIKYLQHIKRLSDYKFGNASFLFQFGLIGVSGFVVNEIVVTILHFSEIPLQLTLALGILIAMTSNFFLNRTITFDHGVKESWFKQYIKFVCACSFGALINYLASIRFLAAFPSYSNFPQISVAIGSLAGLVSNFLLSRYVVFRKNLVLSPKSK